MTTRARRLAALAAAAVLAGALGGACASSVQPTPIIIIVTPTPKPTEAPTPTPVATEAPSAGESASASASASATPVPTPAPSGGGLVGVEYCTGSATIKSFFTMVANDPKVAFGVYCGHMPSGWGVKPPDGLNYATPSGGSWLTGIYIKSGGATVTVKEGKYGTDICSTSSTGTLGTANFASMSGTLHSISGGFAICINPGSKSAYEVSGTGINQSTFTSIAANLALVPKT
jgi:hypothetical protein